MLKIGTWLNKMHKKLMKIKIIKAFLGLITVIMSYKLVNYFFKFNKIIMYLLGLVLVGTSWEDLKILSSIKLIYDDFKLYVLSFFNQDTEIIKNKTFETKNDIKKIINEDLPILEKEVTTQNSKTKDVIEKADDRSIFKSLRDYYKNKVIYDDQITISDNNGNSWTLKEILSDPKIIIVIIALIIISGAVVISIYDISMDQITHFPLDLLKMTWAGISLLFWKLINLFRRGNGQPPLDPDDSDQEQDIEVRDNRTYNYMKDRYDSLFADTSTKAWLKHKDEIISLRKDLKDLMVNDPLNPTIHEKRVRIGELIRATNNAELSTATKFQDTPIDNAGDLTNTGDLTPKASGSNYQLPDFETNAFNKLAEERAYNKGKNINLTTSDQQAEYFNKTSSMKDSSILLSDDDDIE